MRKQILFLGAMGLVVSSFSIAGCGKKTKTDTYDKDGNLMIHLRNLYFNDYQGGGEYLKRLEKKFKVSLSFENYQDEQWQTQVTSQIKGGDIPDVFHSNVTNYNFVNTYKKWAKENVTKPLPEDLSRWPYLKNVLDNTTNKDALLINGRLYGIPIAKNTSDFSITFSQFTYLYRRDWAKQWGVYQENDEYTWEQFEALLAAFTNHLDKSKNQYALGDVEWGFPSITNFYKSVPHCFAYDEVTDKYVNNYLTDEYITGLEKSKEFAGRDKGYYYPSQNTLQTGDMRKEFMNGRIGVFYENISYANYWAIRDGIMDIVKGAYTEQQLDDVTAIMKVRGPDGKYALEGIDNWYSMTLFDKRISDAKLEKILDILDWLLSPEGTELAVYGIEGYDYLKDPETGKIELIPESWHDSDGKPIDKKNGANYVRYLVTLGNDTLSINPSTDWHIANYLDDWEAEMKTAYANNELRIFKEKDEVMWLDTQLKSLYSENIRSGANKVAMQYTYSQISLDTYKGSFGYPWGDVLNEINTTLHKI